MKASKERVDVDTEKVIKRFSNTLWQMKSL